ncbi:hypothetical protein GOP47_0009251 [Adiantum capillus-veneris]|uniref:60S ribosomal protein L36 n=1 Tax=Adiantum capillus-veneris TaxID=13818 RepID=A0A9D4ZJH3_ADICA|nr:hypothetical protein GOP47_0009251 [Adiantum capillus-veneris]
MQACVAAPPASKSKSKIIEESTRKRKQSPGSQLRAWKVRTRTSFVRKLIQEGVGFAPYEKRITELLKVGKDKRPLKMAKRRLGTHLRGRKKREEMSVALRKQRSTGGTKKKK